MARTTTSSRPSVLRAELRCWGRVRCMRGAARALTWGLAMVPLAAGLVYMGTRERAHLSRTLRAPLLDFLEYRELFERYSDARVAPVN